MPQSAQTPAAMELKASEKIPPLNSICSSIFVPLRDDLLATEPPRDRIERLKRILQSIDYQREDIKENLLYMFEREKTRVVLRAAEMEQEQGPPKIKPGLAPAEVDDIIANMEAPAHPGKDYNLQNLPEWAPFTPIPPTASLRERTVMELLNMVERALLDLHGFEKVMAGIKNQYLEQVGVPGPQCRRKSSATRQAQRRAGRNVATGGKRRWSANLKSSHMLP
ncbi:hypothetical protein C8A01DRAFT_12917 [Parachaetomium inaequale]|uniref:Uncharacterized protein n=1 Tax=Parachaetomium inaequale TaxID=2588326 RepID=A0AAN6PQT3_9PEZI|nr:hypothetical protein C8A01DRAFT_12917 [Parachaetomium inaequale]